MSLNVLSISAEDQQRSVVFSKSEKKLVGTVQLIRMSLNVLSIPGIYYLVMITLRPCHHIFISVSCTDILSSKLN